MVWKRDKTIISVGVIVVRNCRTFACAGHGDGQVPRGHRVQQRAAGGAVRGGRPALRGPRPRAALRARPALQRVHQRRGRHEEQRGRECRPSRAIQLTIYCLKTHNKMKQ